MDNVESRRGFWGKLWLWAFILYVVFFIIEVFRVINIFTAHKIPAGHEIDYYTGATVGSALVLTPLFIIGCVIGFLAWFTRVKDKKAQ